MEEESNERELMDHENHISSQDSVNSNSASENEEQNRASQPQSPVSDASPSSEESDQALPLAQVYHGPLVQAYLAANHEADFFAFLESALGLRDASSSEVEEFYSSSSEDEDDLEDQEADNSSSQVTLNHAAIAALLHQHSRVRLSHDPVSVATQASEAECNQAGPSQNLSLEESNAELLKRGEGGVAKKKEKKAFDKALAASHAYMDVDHIRGRVFIEAGEIYTLPVWPTEFVFYPTRSLPLCASAPASFYRILHRALHTEDRSVRLIAAVPLYARGSLTVGTVAELVSSSMTEEEEMGSSGVGVRQKSIKCIARGRGRFRILEEVRLDGIIFVRVCILDDKACLQLPRFLRTDYWWEKRRKKQLEKEMKNPILLPHTPAIGGLPRFVYRQHDVDYFRNKIHKIAALYFGETPPKNNAEYSFWLAAQLPIRQSKKRKILECNNIVARFKLLYSYVSLLDGKYFLCSRCKNMLASIYDMISMNTEGVLSPFVNSYGVVHETLTVKTVLGIQSEGVPSTADCWFPGYSWTIVYCKRCGLHCGWHYIATVSLLKPSSFFGLRSGAIMLGKGQVDDDEDHSSEEENS